MPQYETVHIVVDDGVIANGEVWVIIHPVWWLADIYHAPSEYRRSLERFSVPQRLVFALRWYIEEVNNGGHHQFYYNHTGIVWKDACKAFAAVNVKKGADIILESADRMGGTPSFGREQRLAELDEYNPDFSDLDEKFYELEKTTDIEEAMIAYIRENAAAFHFSGEITRVVLPKFR